MKNQSVTSLLVFLVVTQPVIIKAAILSERIKRSFLKMCLADIYSVFKALTISH